tara:strand:+ start:8860 stop:9990 length:1131 start_codon:yes stop_codon:yes gene_type:complete
MKFIYSILILSCIVLFNTDIQSQSASITDSNISKITERLENLSTVELVERRAVLINSLNDEGEDSDAVAMLGSRSERLLELSIIEQLLILAGVILVDNVTEDSTTPPDTVSPVISVLGDNPATVELGDVYVDAGATADTGETVVTIGTVDTNTVGSYTITYTATDSAGNIGTATRTVNVVDTTDPVITITGDNPATVELGTAYSDAGATATDLDDVTVTSTSNVDTDTVGTYSVVYTATDASGNSSTASRTVNVIDTTSPIINSPSSFTVVENQLSIGTVEVSDAGDVTFSVTGSDIIVIDQNGVLSFVTAPDFESQTIYTVVVTVTDASGNSVSQEITINITNDPDDDDDDTGTGTGTGTGTNTGTGTGTGTGTS